ncbi:MAG: 30S ribosomal protein S17 [bacterium]|nr:30S ribosomal protein S17 [bacterium]
MENNSNSNKILAKKKGTVVSDKGNKTAIIAVDIFKTHKKYQKRYKSTKRYKAHDEENKCKIGDTVEIVACRPMSKDKKYKVV